LPKRTAVPLFRLADLVAVGQRIPHIAHS
jgi:hypothetical protein